MLGPGFARGWPFPLTPPGHPWRIQEIGAGRAGGVPGQCGRDAAGDPDLLNSPRRWVGLVNGWPGFVCRALGGSIRSSGVGPVAMLNAFWPGPGQRENVVDIRPKRVRVGTLCTYTPLVGIAAPS